VGHSSDLDGRSFVLLPVLDRPRAGGVAMSDIITSVYGGRATITFKPGKHIYTVEVPSKGIVDLWQPSVTGIIGMMSMGDGLMYWGINEMVAKVEQILASDPAEVMSKSLFRAVLQSAKETWKKSRDEYADIGTYVHNFLEGELKYRSGLGPSPTLPLTIPAELRPSVEKASDAGKRFFDKHRIELIQAEAPRWSATYGYIGTGDLIAIVDGKLSALDYKTSKRLYPKVFLQLAAYQMAYQEEFPGQEIEQRTGINVGRDGVLSHESRDNSTLQSDFKCFLGLQTAWQWSRLAEGKEIPAVVGAIQ
jgi:hypothetical protein